MAPVLGPCSPRGWKRETTTVSPGPVVGAIMMSEYVMETWERWSMQWRDGKESEARGHAPWREAELETWQRPGTAGYEEPAQPPGVIVISGHRLPLRAI